MTKEFIAFGHAERTHGVKGGFTLEVYNLEESFLRTKPTVWLFPRQHPHKISRLPIEGREYKIKDITFGHKVILYLELVDSMEAAEAMLPFDLKIDERLLPEIDDDEIYLKDLFGMDAVNLSDEKIGEVHAAYENGPQMVLVIKKLSGELVDVPYVDQFIHEIKIIDKKVVVSLPDWSFT